MQQPEFSGILLTLEHRRHALAAADAHGLQAPLGILALHLVEHGGEDAGAGGTAGVDGHRAYFSDSASNWRKRSKAASRSARASSSAASSSVRVHQKLVRFRIIEMQFAVVPAQVQVQRFAVARQHSMHLAGTVVGQFDGFILAVD